MRAFKKPWSAQLQGLVDQIDLTFLSIKDIAHYHGILEGHISLEIGKENLQNSQKNVSLQEQQNAKLEQSNAHMANVEDMLGQLMNVILVLFNKEKDILPSANLLQQRVDEDVREPINN